MVADPESMRSLAVLEGDELYLKWLGHLVCFGQSCRDSPEFRGICG